MLTKTGLLATVLIGLSLPAAAQLSYYESRARQTAEYKSLSNATSRAYSVSGSTYTPPKSSPSSSAPSSSAAPSTNRAAAPAVVNTNKGYSNIGADDKMRRQAEAGERNEARRREQETIISTGEAQYRQLIAGMGIAKTSEDHYDLLLVGMRNGIDLRAVFNVIGKDLAQYKEKWAGQPDQPFLPSDGRVQAAAAAIKELNDPSYKGPRAYNYLQIAKAYPTRDNFYLAANASLLEGRYQDAIYAYEDVLKLQGGDVEAIASMGAAQAFLNYLPQAASSFQSIMDKTDNPDIFIHLAWVQMRQDKPADALQTATKAAELDPIHPGFKLIQASLEPNAATAKALQDKASELLPQLGTGTLSARFLAMAKFLHQEAAYQESLLYLDFALRLDPKNLDLLELRYGTNIKIRRDAEAQKDEKTINSL